MAKKYGVTIWGAELLKVLEQKSDSGRLARGRSYANTGKVYDISLSGTHIRAKVRGNYSPYYIVLVWILFHFQKMKLR